MARHPARLGTLTITSGATESTALSTLTNMKVAVGSAVDLIIYAPAVLTGTVTVEISPVESPSSGDWVSLSLSGSAVTIAAGVGELIPAVAYYDLRLSSGSAEGADRDFIIVAQYDT